MAIGTPLQLSIVLPAYEEGPNLERLLPRLHQVASTLASKYEILVIDTQAPRDNTPEICRQQNALCVPREGGPLYGDAIRTGVVKASGEFVVLMDADGSHNPQHLADLWNHRKDADLVIASRYITGGKTENPALLIFMSLAVNIAFRFVLGLKCRDVSNSFRLYRGADFRALRLQCDNFDIVEEILVKLVAAHPEYRIKEIPCVFEKRKAGRTKRNLVTFAFGYLFTLWRMTTLKRAALKAQAQPSAPKTAKSAKA
jgi:dolichol-phosphate mannosyltransferase